MPSRARIGTDGLNGYRPGPLKDASDKLEIFEENYSLNMRAHKRVKGNTHTQRSSTLCPTSYVKKANGWLVSFQALIFSLQVTKVWRYTLLRSTHLFCFLSFLLPDLSLMSSSATQPYLSPLMQLSELNTAALGRHQKTHC